MLDWGCGKSYGIVHRAPGAIIAAWSGREERVEPLVDVDELRLDVWGHNVVRVN